MQVDHQAEIHICLWQVAYCCASGAMYWGTKTTTNKILWGSFGACVLTTLITWIIALAQQSTCNADAQASACDTKGTWFAVGAVAAVLTVVPVLLMGLKSQPPVRIVWCHACHCSSVQSTSAARKACGHVQMSRAHVCFAGLLRIECSHQMPTPLLMDSLRFVRHLQNDTYTQVSAALGRCVCGSGHTGQPCICGAARCQRTQCICGAAAFGGICKCGALPPRPKPPMPGSVGAKSSAQASRGSSNRTALSQPGGSKSVQKDKQDDADTAVKDPAQLEEARDRQIEMQMQPNRSLSLRVREPSSSLPHPDDRH